MSATTRAVIGGVAGILLGAIVGVLLLYFLEIPLMLQ